MSKGKRLSWVLAGLFGVLGVCWLGSLVLNRSPKSATVPQALPHLNLDTAATTDHGFVGSEVCATCHHRIAESYRQHPMGRSLATAHEATPIENFDVTEFSPPGPRRYRIERTAEGVRHHESLVDEEGAVLYDQSVKVAYTLGSGKRGRAYLIEHDGKLFKSSIAWFSRPKEWGLSPGYPPDQHKRFERRITDGCINCHAGRMEADRRAPDTYVQPVIAELAIGCERCHGPGRKHVEAQESGTPTALAKDHIINPAKLEAARRESVCAQCHLHGKATVMRTNQTTFDFQPGDLLEDNRIVFVTPPKTASESTTNALSQVEQMSSSVCFQKSAGRLGCISCHDPHSLPAPESKVEYYRAKCITCHETRSCGLPVKERLAREANDSCIACHMSPVLHVGNILHVSFTDHRVLRQPQSDRPDEKVSSSAASALAVFDNADQRIPKHELDRATAFTLLGGLDHKSPTVSDARRAERLLMPLLQTHSNDIDVLENLGAACLIQGRAFDAAEWWNEALKLNPRREYVLEHLSLLYFDQRQLPLARESLQRYLAVNSWHGSIHGRLAGVLGSLGEWRESIAIAEHALELNPTLIPLHGWLANAYRQVGNTAESQRHRQLLIRMQILMPSNSPPPETSR